MNRQISNISRDPVLTSVHLYLEGNNGVSTTNFKGFRQLQFKMRYSVSVSLLVCFSLSVVSNSLQPHRLQHPRLSCPLPSPRVCSNSCPSNWRCHPNISPSVVPFSSCPQSFLASGSFPVNQFLASSGQSIGVSASASVLPMNTQG